MKVEEVFYPFNKDSYVSCYKQRNNKEAYEQQTGNIIVAVKPVGYRFCRHANLIHPQFGMEILLVGKIILSQVEFLYIRMGGRAFESRKIESVGTSGEMNCRRNIHHCLHSRVLLPGSGIGRQKAQYSAHRFRFRSGSNGYRIG